MDLQAKNARLGLKQRCEQVCWMAEYGFLMCKHVCLMACGNSKHLCYAYETAQWHKVFHHVLITDVLRLRSSALMIYIYIYIPYMQVYSLLMGRSILHWQNGT